MFAVVMVVLLMSVGLAVDGGAQSAAGARAEAVAAEAARAGAAAGAAGSIQGRGTSTGARLAAQRVLDARGMAGTIVIDDGEVRVTTRTSVPTTFLSIVGITQLPASGSASARLISS